MRVLVVHNRYRSTGPSGENVVVDEELEALRARGVSVDTYIRSSDELDVSGSREAAGVALRFLWSPRALHEAREALVRTRPDVVHVHNVYPLISPLIIEAARERGIPVVQTVHNHRHVCANGLHYRDGAVCHDCVGLRIPWPATLHACYRASRVQSAVMTASLAIHRSRFLAIDRFIALTPLLAEHLRRFGVPAGRISVKPNTVADPGPPTSPGTGFLFAGRLVREKGVEHLLSAWDRIPPHAAGTLTLAGDGPLREEVEALGRRRSDVRYVGSVGRRQMNELMAATAVVVVPSVWPEAFPMVVVEAMAAGRAVLASDIGGLPEVVTPDAGWLVPPNAEALGDAIQLAARSDTRSAGRGARRRYERDFHPDRVISRLVDLYQELVAARRGTNLSRSRRDRSDP